jgi:SAM-dependent methyltransferase
MTDALHLHLGCGTVHLEGWVNVDADPDTHPDLVADVRELPYANDAADSLLACHLLEHFAHDDPVLEEWHRVLRPGGRIVVIVPDLFATYVMRSRPGIGWGPQREHPIDVAYLNAVAFGGPALGPPYDLLGHVDVRTTFGYYVRPVPELQRAAVDAYGEMLAAALGGAGHRTDTKPPLRVIEGGKR